MNWIKRRVADWLRLQTVLAKDLGYEESMPKLFGESQGVTYEKNGLVECYCSAHRWANGEGYDVSFQTSNGNGKWVDKRIELHDDELETLLACLQHLKHFEI